MIDPSKLHQALLKAKIKIAAWLDEKLAAIDTDYWQNLVVPKVSYNQKLNIDRKLCTKLSQLDLAVLLRVLNKNWDDLSYKYNIEGRVRNYLNEVQDIRNRYAHMSDYPTADDFSRDVDTLARLLSGIGIDDEFVSEVRSIGKEDGVEELEPVAADSREPECEEQAEPDVEPVQQDDPRSVMSQRTTVVFPSEGEVEVLRRDPFAPGCSLVKTKMRNTGVVGYSSVYDLAGEDAKNLYLSLDGVPDVPIFAGISYAIIAKQDAPDATDIADAKTMLDCVLSEDHIAGFERCIAQGAPENRLIWIFGEKKISGADSGLPLVTAPVVQKIFSCSLPSWWSKMAQEPQFKALPLLRVEEVQRTMRLSEPDLWRYMKTYAPRSWAEAFYLVKTVDRGVLNKMTEPVGRQIAVLDVGCGVGGALLGVLDSLALRIKTTRPVGVVALDGNDKALELLRGFIDARSKAPDPSVAMTSDVELTCVNRTFAEESAKSTAKVFDIIIASKSLGEDDQGGFENFLEYAKMHLEENGVVLIIDVLKHEKPLKNALSCMGIKGNVVESLEVSVSLRGEKSNDNEKVVTAVIYKSMFD